jgi:DNA-binding NarL/FixJ family response regulator
MEMRWRRYWPQRAWWPARRCRHIARLAAEGLSNREIGQQLYLSHRTVSNHLYRIFPKLGITSRAELAAVAGAAPGLA